MHENKCQKQESPGTKIIVFSHNDGTGEHNTHTEEREFHIDATNEEITEEYIEWVFEQVGDNFTWYEKE